MPFFNTGYIYIIQNTVNNKAYIGQTATNPERRLKEHFAESKCSTVKGYDSLLNRAIRKYGEDAFICKVLEENIPYNELDSREVYWIQYYDSYHNGYNSTKGGKKKGFAYSYDYSKIVERYKENGYNIKQTSLDLDCSIPTVTRAIEAYGVEKPLEHKYNLIIECYNNHPDWTDKQISEEVEVARETVAFVLKKFRLRLPRKERWQQIRDNSSAIIDFYLQDTTINRTAKHFNISWNTVRDILEENNISIINNGIDDKLLEDIAESYKKYGSISKVQKEYKCSSRQVKKACERYGIQLNDMRSAKDAMLGKVRQYTLDGVFITEYNNAKEAAIAIGKKASFSNNINAVMNNPKRSAGGFRWQRERKK